MCGIAGIVNFDGAPVDGGVLQRMNHSMRHRGPDGEGIHIDGGVGFGHRRLAIIDPEGGAQPIVDKRHGLAITYNGEVYNYPEIRDSLAGDGFKTASDTEVVLRAYRQWGIDCLERFRGMFAFAIHDQNKNRVFLVRDRIGIKPLYYSVENKRLVFASELNAVTVAGGQRSVDPHGLAAYLHYQYVPTPQTIFKNVFKLEPGTYLEIDLVGGDIRKHTYWTLAPKRRSWNEGALLEELDQMLSGTSHIYARSDVPFGVFLSGGIDSSMVTAHMARELEEPVRSFTIGFNEKEVSELPFAAQASRILGTNHHEQMVSSDMAMDVLRRVVWHFGEPFGDSSAIPTYYVSKSAGEHVKMVLSGDGGDELFAGYMSYPAIFDQFDYGEATFLHRLSRLWRRTGNGEQTMQQAHDSRRSIFSPGEIGEMVIGTRDFSPPPSPIYPGHGDDFTALQYQDLKTYLLDDILTKVDRMSMAHSLEVRVPLLDHKVVEFAFSLPLAARLQRKSGVGTAVGKYLLKKSAENIFPHEFVHRAKMGFGIPVAEWLAGPLQELIMDNVRSPNSPLFDWLDRPVVDRLIGDYYEGRRSGAAQIWLMLILIIWADEVYRPAPENMAVHAAGTG